MNLRCVINVWIFEYIVINIYIEFIYHETFIVRYDLINILINLIPNSDVYLERCQTSKIQFFVVLINGFQLLILFAKSFFLDI